MRKGEIIGLVILLTGVLMTILLYSDLPGEMTTLWDVDGQSLGGTMVKDNIIKYCLGVMFAIFAVFLVMSRIRKLRPQTKETQFYYSMGLILTLLYIFAVYLSTMLWNLGIKHSVVQVGAVCLGIILFFIGRVIGHAKSHWFVSLRTPWTKRNADVWDRTNCLLGKLFCVIGLCGAVAGLVTFYAVFAVHLAMLAVVFVFIYSFFQYRKIEKSE